MNTKAIDARLKRLETKAVDVETDFDPSMLSEEERKEWDRNMAIVRDIGDSFDAYKFDTYKTLSDEQKAAICALNRLIPR